MKKVVFSFLLLASFGEFCLAEPTVGETLVLGPFTGDGAALHPDNVSPRHIRYYGTDLGFTYEHNGQIQILFGDTMATEDAERIEASTGAEFDDGFGTIDLGKWTDPELIAPQNIPLIKLGQNPGTNEMSAINPGHAMEGFKTPVGGFSNGTHEFGFFYLSKPEGCRVDGDCSNGLTCDQGIGYVGEKYTTDKGLTFGCVEGSSPACTANTMVDASGAPVDGSGFCIDETSTVWADTGTGRVGAMGVKIRIGIRDTSEPRRYSPKQDWLTNKFLNIAVRTVDDFAPDSGPGRANQDYRTATEAGRNQRIFLWGRPAFIGVNARGRTAGLYFAYVDLPADQDFDWNVQYFTGTNKDGVPQFGSSEKDAVALDLDSTDDGDQVLEAHDIVNQLSVAWIEHLNKWLMFYGGGLTNLPYPPALLDCGILEVFTGADCTDVVMGNGAIRMRTADDPWGPWTPPQDVIVGGDPSVPGSGQYGIGGMLRHPACTVDGCAPHTKARDVNPNEYGFLYSANIIEQWIKPVGDGVDIIWNASTWDPYRVILLRTRIDP